MYLLTLLPFPILAFLSFTTAQDTSVAPGYTSIASAPLPTPPPLSQPDVATLISSIPACWAPCVGGAIEQVCPTTPTWSCACNAYENATNSQDFIYLSTYDAVCADAMNCSDVVGMSDGGQQTIGDLLVDICIALPGALTSSIASAEGALPTSDSTSTSTAKPTATKNAAAMTASVGTFLPWQFIILPLAVLGGLFML